MAFVMKIDTSEVDRWVNNQANRDRAKRQALTVMKNELVEEVKKQTGEHRTTGELENSVMGLSTDRKLEIYSAMYGDIVLEYGRRPGKFPPVEPLERWALAHGMKKGAGFMIARKIARSGTDKFRKKAPRQITEIESIFNREIMPTRMVTLLNEYTR